MLIHSGSGGVGQAAIRIALSLGCQVFTTVGTADKREFLMETFPQLDPNHISNSRDLSFETRILKATKGKGGLAIPCFCTPLPYRNASIVYIELNILLLCHSFITSYLWFGRLQTTSTTDTGL